MPRWSPQYCGDHRGVAPEVVVNRPGAVSGCSQGPATAALLTRAASNVGGMTGTIDDRRTAAGCVVAWLLLLGLAACGTGTTTAPLPAASPDVLVTPLPAGQDGTVDRVVDGDTLIVDGRRVRIIGVDTPETVKPNTPVQCYGPEASAATKALLPKGTAVRLVRGADPTDRYGRDLAYVYRSRDGLFLEGYLAQEGFARTLAIAPNTVHRQDLAALVAQARSTNRGLWAACH